MAEALEAAGGQGLFWEMNDWFYERQHQLEGLDLENHAGVVGLDVTYGKRSCGSTPTVIGFHEDIETGRQSEVSGTPTFFMNSVRNRGDSEIGSMLAAIQEQALN